MHDDGSSARLKSLRISNFKSVKETTVSFRPLTCLVGPNNSGKTNILDSLRFLSSVARGGLAEALGDHGGRGRMLHYGAPAGAPIALEVSWRGAFKFDYSDPDYSIQFTEEDGILNEILRAGEGGSSRIDLFRRERLRSILRGRAPDGEVTEIGSMGSPWEASIRSFSQDPAIAPVRDVLLGWQGFRFVPQFLKAPGPAVQTPALDRHGSNFASYLHSLQSENRRAFRAIEEQLMKSFPEVEELVTPLVGNQTVIGIREHGYSKPAIGPQLSDGLVGFLAHLTVLYGPQEPSLVIFEELESYIHARLMERLVEMMRENARTCQTILTTHSVSLLNRLELEDVVLVEREDGATIAKVPADSACLRQSLQDWALGEAYVSGALGGV